MTEKTAMDDGALASDLIEGADGIAAFIYGDAKKRRRVYHLADKPDGPEKIPVFRLGSILCARKSTLLRWITEREGNPRGQATKATARPAGGAYKGKRTDADKAV